MLFFISLPQPVNNSHQQPLSHSPTSLTSIQSSDSLHIKWYFNIHIRKMCYRKWLYVFCRIHKSIFRQHDRTTLLLISYDNKIIVQNDVLWDFKYIPFLSILHSVLAQEAQHSLLNLVCLIFPFFIPSALDMQLKLHLSCYPWTIKYFVHCLNKKTVKLWWDEETETEWCKDR